MNEFQDIAAFLASARDRMDETIRDGFGSSFIADVFEPLLSDVNGLASLGDEAEDSLNAVDRVIAEARSFGELESR